MNIRTDAYTDQLIREYDRHLSLRPPIDPDYAANIDHLRIEMDQWRAHENALRIVLADRLITEALGTYSSERPFGEGGQK